MTAALLTGLSLLTAAACVPTAKPKPPTVIVYGDSLTFQSETAAGYLYRNVNENVVWRATIGFAMCDWLTQAKEDQLILKPQRVILAFTGNTLTPCVHKTFTTSGAAATIAIYQQSLRQMRAIFPSAQITILIPPAVSNPTDPSRLNGSPALVAMYEQVGPQLHMAINPDADNWLTPHHVFAPLRPSFPMGPLVSVRTADGLHLTQEGADWYGAALLEVKQWVPPAPKPSPAPKPTPTPTPIPTPTPTPTVTPSPTSSVPGPE